jgi:glycosyltransferase involved in cell wall biosynthesis
MKSILFFDCSQGISGAEISLISLVNNLNRNKFKLYLITNNEKLKTKVNITKTEIVLINLKWLKRTKNPFLLLFYILQILCTSIWLVAFVTKNNIDVVCSNTVKSFIHVWASSFFLKKRNVVIVRDNTYQCRLSQFILKKADNIISVSEFVNKQIKTDRPQKNIIYGGVDGSCCNNRILKKELRIELGIDHNTTILAQICQLTPWKNHIDFIKAAHIIIQKFKNVHFLIVGDCISSHEYSYKEDLLSEVKYFGLTDKFSFLGFRNDIKEIISQIDLLIHPAINEPFGRVLIEAMIMEKPVIAYNCGGPKEIIENNETGFLIRPFDFIRLAEKSIDLLNMKTIQKQLGEAGRKTVVKKFNLQNQINLTETIFEYI